MSSRGVASPLQSLCLGFFALLALAGWWLGVPLRGRLWLLVAPLLLFLVAQWEQRRPGLWLRRWRQWLSLALLLVAYQSMRWFASPGPYAEWRFAWLQWDRWLLDTLALRQAVEATGRWLPELLELLYLLLYAFPVVALAWIYHCGRERSADAFLFILFAASFAAYGLAPLVVVPSPRTAWPDLDMPTLALLMRKWNFAVLQKGAVESNIFPSGHVAVAYGSALGLMRVLPEQQWLARVALLLATLVWGATVYGRYHYFVDGLASLFLALLAFRLEALWNKSSSASVSR
jgi:membrane-associated phospholipid phosphatase